MALRHWWPHLPTDPQLAAFKLKALLSIALHAAIRRKPEASCLISLQCPRVGPAGSDGILLFYLLQILNSRFTGPSHTVMPSLNIVALSPDVLWQPRKSYLGLKDCISGECNSSCRHPQTWLLHLLSLTLSSRYTQMPHSCWVMLGKKKTSLHKSDSFQGRGRGEVIWCPL